MLRDVHPIPERTPGLSWWDSVRLQAVSGLKPVPSKWRYLVPPTALLLHQLANVENGHL